MTRLVPSSRLLEPPYSPSLSHIESIFALVVRSISIMAGHGRLVFRRGDGTRREWAANQELPNKWILARLLLPMGCDRLRVIWHTL